MMSLLRRSVPVLAGALMLAWPPAAHAQDQARFGEVTELLEAFVAQGRIAGAVAAVTTGGENVYSRAVGLQTVESRTPMTEGSIFRIYSMSKPVTAVAAMMLWEEGRFQLDDPVSLYIPDFANLRVADGAGGTRPPAREVTVRDLMLHTSGLNHRTSALYRDAGVRARDMPMSQYLANLVGQPLMEDPGTRFRYSEGPTVLGALVEVWSGQSLDVFLEERLFRPLEMVDTGFMADQARAGRLATVYESTNDGRLEPVQMEATPFTQRPDLLEGAIGLVSTVSDYMRFSRMLLNGGALDGVRILREETVEAMTRNDLSEAVLAARPGTMGWGLGNVEVVLEPDSLPYPANRGEYGWGGSAGTVFWIDPASETIIILMTQNSPANPDSLRERVKNLVDEALFDRSP